MIQLLIELKLIMANRWLSKMTASFEFDSAVPRTIASMSLIFFGKLRTFV